MSRGRAFFKRKAGRRDGNHATIRDGLRALGFFVVDTAGVGDGVPDLLVYPRNPADVTGWHRAVWLELKVKKGKLRITQLAWRMSANLRGIPVKVAHTLDEALEALP